jgi:threonine aldolase
MKQAMFDAELGDEQLAEDPTALKLEEHVSRLLGKEAAVFVPSGTMCNQIALRIHCEPGDEIIMDQTGHAWNSETGGPAALSGAQIYPLNGERGLYQPSDLVSAIRKSGVRRPRSRLALIEQTSNFGGGTVWPLELINSVCDAAKEHGLACHMDGARLLNACARSGVSAAAYSAPFDSVWIDFSKGLGAPIGAALAGSRGFIEEAWRWKNQFGGAMRQSGIVAAAALYALENNVDRLTEDNENAQLLAGALSEVSGIEVEPAETNIVFFDVAGLGVTAEAFVSKVREKGVRVTACSQSRIRAVTHLDVSRDDILEAIEIITKASL